MKYQTFSPGFNLQVVSLQRLVNQMGVEWIENDLAVGIWRFDAMTEYEVTLEQMLLSRDNRAANQHKLITTYALPLISFTVNMPGPKKNTIYSRRIFHEGCHVLISDLENNGIYPVHQETKELPSGMEKYIVVDMDEYALKELTLKIEEQHPLGRLWDFDVINKDGMPISRESLGYPKRKCLLCDNQAHACARSRAHTLPEVLIKIHSMTDEYFRH